VEYKNEGHRMFKELLIALDRNIAITIFKVGPPRSQTAYAPTHSHSKLSSGNLGGQTTPQAPEREKIGRNDPCPCGAKKSDGTPVKYKHCHGK